MARTSRGMSRTPFAVIGRCRWPDSTVDEWVICRRRTLTEAKRVVAEYTNAWSRLIGGLFSPLSWYVLDERDYTTHHLGRAFKEGQHHGETIDGRPWHYRTGSAA